MAEAAPFSASVSLELAQVVDVVRVGVVVVDADLRVYFWNRWMEEHSGYSRAVMLDQTLSDMFPDMQTKALQRKIRQVLTLGNFAFIDARLQGYLFPFNNAQQLGRRFDLMKQSCILAPLAGADGQRQRVCITVTDETNIVSAEAALQEAHAQLEFRSRRDSLTQLFNRGYTCEMLEQEIHRVHRCPSPLSVVVVDVDWFKSVNDRWGHLAGDAVLRGVAAALAAGVRQTDLAGRYGGEEFVMVLPDTAADGALILAERLRRDIEAMEIDWKGQDIRVTASFGIAQLAPGQSMEALLNSADVALYKAKAEGRNRVVVA